MRVGDRPLFALWLACHAIVSQAIVCPPCGPGTDNDCPQAINKEGDECGGLCGESGWCSEKDGLRCIRPVDPDSAASPLLKHAMGLPRSGKCARFPSTELKDNGKWEVIQPFGMAPDPIAADELTRRELALCPGVGGSGEGCPSPADPGDRQVVAAAEAAVGLIRDRGDFGAEAQGTKLDKVLSATKQVVSGIRYRMTLQLKTEATPPTVTTYSVDIVSQPWLRPAYHLISATKVDAPAPGPE